MIFSPIHPAMIEKIKTRSANLGRSSPLQARGPEGTGSFGFHRDGSAQRTLFALRQRSRHRQESPADLSPELTKHLRGLRLWLPLKLPGLKPFRAALEENLLLARYFHQRLQSLDGFEVGPYPDLSVVLFRYVPEQGDADAFNEKLVKAIHRDGRVFLSSTRIDGRFYLHLAALCFRTHLDTIDLAVEILKEKIEAIH